MNPFADDIFSGSLSSEPTLTELYQDQLHRLAQAIELTSKSTSGLPMRRGGRTLLLSSPIAGAGKSHLLARLRAEQSGAALFFEVTLSDTQEFRWEIWLDRLLRGLHENDRKKTSLTPLARQTAHALVAGIDQLKAMNALADAPSPGELQWLRDHSTQLFAKTTNPHATVRWFHQQSNELLPKISRAFASQAGFPEERLHTWIKFLYQYGLHTPAEGSTEALSGSAAQCQHLRNAPSLTSQANRLQVRSDLQLLGHLLTLELPLAPIFDHLDWVYRDQESSLQLTRMILEFGKLVPRSLSLIGMNEDTWKASFIPALPSALMDRLTAQQCRVSGVPKKLWTDFLRKRAAVPGTDEASLDSVAQRITQTHSQEDAIVPRRLIREACQLWAECAPQSPVAAPKKSVPEAPIFAKPQTQGSPPATSPVPRSMTPASPETRRPTPDQSTLPSEATRPWSAAMGDLRSLIQKKTSDQETAKASEAPSQATPEPPKETTTPVISDAFKNFMAKGQADDAAPSSPGQSKESSGSPAGTIQPNGQARTSDTPPIDHTQAVSPAAIQLRLRKLKHERMGDAAGAPIDVNCMKRLIQLAGQRFPAISQQIGDGQPTECQWRFQQSEVHFSFHSHEDTAYWRKRLARVAQRAQELRKSERTRVKLAVFARRGEESRFEAWSTSEDETNHFQFCDLVLLTHAQAATINAVDQLLKETPEPNRATVFSQVSSELDFLWKMITRPVWTLIDPRDRHAS